MIYGTQQELKSTIVHPIRYLSTWPFLNNIFGIVQIGETGRGHLHNMHRLNAQVLCGASNDIEQKLFLMWYFRFSAFSNICIITNALDKVRSLTEK